MNIIKHLFAWLHGLHKLFKTLTEIKELLTSYRRKYLSKGVMNSFHYIHNIVKCLSKTVDNLLTTAKICPTLKHLITSIG